MEPRLTVQLTLKAYDVLLHVATGFVEQSALAFGLGKKEALTLALATEEVFLYLCHISSPGTELEISCRSNTYRAVIGFLFEAAHFELSGFNLTAAAPLEDGTCIREMGLLIASRVVDRFSLQKEGNHLLLTFAKDKAYPKTDVPDAPVPAPVSVFSIHRPNVEEVKAAVRLVRHCFREQSYPPVVDLPGKVADIFAAGELNAALAVDKAEHVGGALFWTRDSREGVECFGPYIFHAESDPKIAIALLDCCVEEISRTGVMGLVNRYSGSGLPPGYFESLGALTLFREDGTREELQASYRYLREDRGSTVWAHPVLLPFLKTQYERLTLPREIQSVTSEGEELNPFAVLSVEMNRLGHRAVLRPLVYGKNASKILAEHIRLLEREGFSAVFFEMDLKKAWHVHFGPCLLQNGFKPELVLPYGGKGDVLVFQYKAECKA